jgi:hypothetical protein
LEQIVFHCGGPLLGQNRAIRDGTGKIKFIYPNDFQVRQEAPLPMGFCPKSIRPTVETMANEANSELEDKNSLGVDRGSSWHMCLWIFSYLPSWIFLTQASEPVEKVLVQATI